MNYVAPIAIVLAAVFLKNGVWKGLVGTAVVAALMGVVIATLLCKERQFSRAPMGESLKGSLLELLALVNSTSRAYMVAYMTLMGLGLGVLAGMAFWKFGVGAPSFAVSAACAAGLLWAYRSGQAYVQRMFGKYRMALAECLREAEER